MENTNLISEQKKSPRNSAIELLRIIAMLMIVFHHFAAHGSFNFTATTLSVPRFWYYFIYMGGKIAVDVFVLITGYFLIKDTGPTFNLKKTLKIWCQICFYALILYLAFVFKGTYHFGVKALIRNCMPITYNTWWFASTYFLLYLFHPFLNKLLLNLSKNTYRNLLILAIICWSIIPTFTKMEFGGNVLLWFITLYSISAYIRLYGLNAKFQHKHYLIATVVLITLNYLLTVAFALLGTTHKFFYKYVIYLYGQNKITTLIISVCFFMTFVTLKMKYHKWINVVASGAFGVYLISDYPKLRDFIWTHVFKLSSFIHSSMIIPYSIVTVIAIFVACTIIDILRKYLIEKPFMKFIDRYSENILKPIHKFFNFLKRIVCGA